MVYKPCRFLKSGGFACGAVVLCLALVALVPRAQAETSLYPPERTERVQDQDLRKGSGKFFPQSFALRMFDGRKVTRFAQPVEVKAQAESEVLDKAEEPPIVEYQTSDPSKKRILPPGETPSVAVDPNAPSSIIGLIENNRRGDRTTAKEYAKQFVRMLQNYFFEVRDITQLIGEALIEEQAIKEDDWDGAEQAIDYELAKTRLETGAAIKPTHDVAMKRITPDPQNQVEVFYIFSRTCSWCRHMAPDVERLWQVAKTDPRIKMTALTLGEIDPVWLAEYRAHTGLTVPIFDGTELARHLNLKFVPVVLVVQPNGKRSYFKSGQQTFEHMYEFVRTAQGLPVEDSPALQALIRTPIGEIEQAIKGNQVMVSQADFRVGAGVQKVALPASEKQKIEVDRF